MITSAVTPAISRLSRDGDLVFWSLIVSALGELTQSPDDVITNRLFSEMTGLMGLKPEALRVALHRLRKDGWINSLKTGRTVVHRLSARGYAETLRARARIYADKPAQIQLFTLAISQIGTKNIPTALGGEWIPLTPGTYLTSSKDTSPPAGFFVITGTIDSIPDWLPERVAPDALAQRFARLAETLHEVNRLLAPAPPLPPLERACLRVLIVHHWRRLLLRCPDLPDRFFPPDWPGLACRAIVTTLLAKIPRPELSELADI